MILPWLKWHSGSASRRFSREKSRRTPRTKQGFIRKDQGTSVPVSPNNRESDLGSARGAEAQLFRCSDSSWEGLLSASQRSNSAADVRREWPPQYRRQESAGIHLADIA